MYMYIDTYIFIYTYEQLKHCITLYFVPILSYVEYRSLFLASSVQVNHAFPL